ncbi:MAG TPA: efflux RND transporter periplasmic adaptor subunit [Salinisphaeraceae bacterium]|nr:efflux RND transporter periplasmic adaptor subunit [Salinisphaeraceae bacterium]
MKLRKMHGRHGGCWWLTVAIIMLLAGGGNARGQDGSGQDNDQQVSPTPAKVMTMAPRDITLDKSYPAKLRNNRMVTVIARVRGLLEEQHFQPGNQVQQGDQLYTIEPDVYQAAVNERKADLKSAKAKARQSEQDVERARKLLQENATSEQQAEQKIAQSRVDKAAVAQARAALASARIDLGHTRVTAPVTGQIGLSQVNVGNVVDAGTELVTITPLDTLEARFQLPLADAFALRRQRQNKTADVSAVLEFPTLKNSDATTLKGNIDFLGASVNLKTNTVPAQAVFVNKNHLYLPGQFVRVQLKGLKRYNVLAVPEIAVTQGLMGPRVFTLDQDNVTQVTNVTLGEEAVPWIIISDGLDKGDRVIVSDPGAIEAGMKIKPQAFHGNADMISAQKGQEQASEQSEDGNGGDAASSDSGTDKQADTGS